MELVARAGVAQGATMREFTSRSRRWRCKARDCF